MISIIGMECQEDLILCGLRRFSRVPLARRYGRPWGLDSRTAYETHLVNAGCSPWVNRHGFDGEIQNSVCCNAYCVFVETRFVNVYTAADDRAHVTTGEPEGISQAEDGFALPPLFSTAATSGRPLRRSIRSYKGDRVDLPRHGDFDERLDRCVGSAGMVF